MVGLYENAKPVRVRWKDAITYTREDKIMMDVPLKNLLAECITYGVIIQEDESGIVIMHEDAQDEADFTVIPAGWYIIEDGEKQEMDSSISESNDTSRQESTKE